MFCYCYCYYYVSQLTRKKGTTRLLTFVKNEIRIMQSFNYSSSSSSSSSFSPTSYCNPLVTDKRNVRLKAGFIPGQTTSPTSWSLRLAWVRTLLAVFSTDDESWIDLWHGSKWSSSFCLSRRVNTPVEHKSVSMKEEGRP